MLAFPLFLWYNERSILPPQRRIKLRCCNYEKENRFFPYGKHSAPALRLRLHPRHGGGKLLRRQCQSSDGTYHVGDTISTAFFDFTVNSAVASADHEDYTAQDGYKLVVADLTIKNTETYSMPMGQYDFMIAWGDGDEDFAYPLNQYCESQLADEYEIPIAGSAEGSLVFEVPSDQKDFALGFEEYYEDESVGDLYVVYFTAE